MKEPSKLEGRTEPTCEHEWSITEATGWLMCIKCRAITTPKKLQPVPPQPQEGGTAPAMPTGIAPGNNDTPERKLLIDAYDALRSYQFGNGCTDLAAQTANAIGMYFSGGRP